MQTIKPKRGKVATSRFLIVVQKSKPPHHTSKLININHVLKIDADTRLLTFTMENGEVISANNDNDIWRALMPFIGGIENAKN